MPYFAQMAPNVVFRVRIAEQPANQAKKAKNVQKRKNSRTHLLHMSDCFLSLTIQFYYSYPLNFPVVVRKVYITGDCGERPRNDVYEV